MDSLTQLALGAAMGELVMGRKIAGKAALYGAAIATLPDLDVLVPMGGPVADFTYHRSWSHSLIVLALVTPVLAFAVQRWRRDPPEWLKAWMLLVFLALMTHPLLDAFTIYGTQLLWPLTEYPFGIGSIFIIDPLYTLPLVTGLLMALAAPRASAKRMRRISAGLVVSSAYLAWTVVGQSIARQVAIASLESTEISTERVLTIPAPFNTLLWRTIAMDEDGSTYHVGYHSLLDGTSETRFRSFASGHGLLRDISESWSVRRLAWFSKGFYNAQQVERDVRISDLRMGVEGQYVFTFKVGQREAGQTISRPDQRFANRRDLSGLSRVWSRIWDADVNIVLPDGK